MRHAGHNFWSPGGQIGRILRNDFRRFKTDILLGFVYILASYAVSRPTRNDPHGYLVAPVAVTSLCVLYLNARLIAEETAAETIQFFTNLPRGKMLTYWTRTLFVIGIMALYYLANFAGLHFKSYFDPGHSYAVRSIHWALPVVIFVITCWCMYLVQNQLNRSSLLSFCITLAYMWVISPLIDSKGPGFNMLSLILIISPLLLALLARKWKRLQPGEGS